MPYDPTADAPDVQAERRPPEDHPTTCQECSGLLDVVSGDGEAFAATCSDCGVGVVSEYPDEYEWVYPGE